MITGLYAPDRGRIHLSGQDISGLPAHEIACRGIGRAFQLEELFGSLSVLENVMVGCHIQSRSGMLSCGLSLPSARREERKEREVAMANLQGIGLAEKAGDPISKLPRANGSWLG